MGEGLVFVILAWNAEKYLSECLHSVCALSFCPTSVFVVDNGSTDGTAEILSRVQRENEGKIHVLSLSRNTGTTLSRNRILRDIPDDTGWVCVLDADTVVNESAIKKLIEALRADENALLSCPRMWNEQDVEQISCKRFPSIFGKICKAIPLETAKKKGERLEKYPFSLDPNSVGRPPVSPDTGIYPVDYGISACWMLKRKAIDEIGLLDERIFYSPEDVDYCVRIRCAGYGILFVSGASIYHMTQRLSHKKFFSRITFSHLKGLFYFFRKHRVFLKNLKE